MLNEMDRIYFLNEQEKLKKIKIVFGYSRKSRGVTGKDLKVDSAEVLKKQRDRIHKIAEIYNWDLRYFEEIGSGGSLADRKKMNEMIEAINVEIKNKKIKPNECLILGFDIDRLGREDDMLDFYRMCRLEEIFIGDTVEDKIFNLNDNTDKTYFDMKILFAGMELRKYKIRTKEHKIFAFQNGHWLGGTIPFPYEYNPSTKGLKIIENYREIYKELIENFLNGWSYSALAKFLDENNIPTPHMKKRITKGWIDKSVQTLLTSEVHRGMLCQKGFKNPKGEYIKLPFEEWNINYNPKWETLIDESLNNKIMAKFYDNKKKSKKGANQIHSLSGLIYCGDCGKRLTVFVKPNKDLAIRSCKGKEDKKCSNNGGRADIIERDIFELLENIVEDLETTGEIKNNIEDKIIFYQIKIDKINEEIKKKENQLKNTQDMLREMWSVLTKEQKEEETKLIQNINEEITILNGDIIAFQEEIYELETQKTLSSLERFKTLIEKLKKQESGEKRNRIYRNFIHKIWWWKTDQTMKFTLDMKI